MRREQITWKGAAVVATTTIGVAVLALPSVAATSAPSPLAHLLIARAHGATVAKQTASSGDSVDATANQANQEGAERTAPGTSVPAGAYAAAERGASALPVTGGAWHQVTDQVTNAQPAGYNDPFWSNVGAGFRQVSGRMTALANDGSTVYAGGAAGGVWKSTTGTGGWVPIFDHGPTLSIGALAVDHGDHSLWVGTGEANTNADAYAGEGVFRSADGGRTFVQVGGAQLDATSIYKLTLDGAGNLYAATNHGLYRHSTSGAAAALGSPWALVLKPDPNPSGNPYETSFITSVVVRPGTRGQVVLAADGWRGGGSPPRDTRYNGFYVSVSGGRPGTFHEVTPTGQVNAKDIGRTTFAWSADGSKLYAIVESPSALLSGAGSVLQGVFVSGSGDPFGPWSLVADAAKLCASGSALTCPSTYEPGVQAWYNQAIAVDPANPDHVVIGLEEQYQSFNAGQTWTAISPYWNYGLKCSATCPPTTHPDQHADLIVGSTLYIGNDGGIYSRSLGDTAPRGDWRDLNDTLHTLQYYDAESGALGVNTSAKWGGLQDNGTMVLDPHANNVEPAGGDGGYVIVNPANGQDAVGEYVYLSTYMTTDGGHTFTNMSPACATATGSPIKGCDPLPRFIAPLATDVKDPGHWVAGGEYVWDDTAAWSTVCNTTSCDWKNVHDTGAGHSITALAVNGAVTYAGWCGACNPGGSTPFSSHIDTNYGGAWHTITAPALPRRYISGLTVDPSNPAHVYATYSGFSRNWIPSAGTGHVFESTDGGKTWTDDSLLLPDVPANALVLTHGMLAVATDIGVFVAPEGGGSNTAWSRLGTDLPNVPVNNLRLDPNGVTLLAATHGRGLWRLMLP